MNRQAGPISLRFSYAARAGLLIGALVCLPVQIKAQTASEIAGVDLGKVMGSSLGQSFRGQLESQQRELEAPLQREMEALQTEVARLEQDIREGNLTEQGVNRRRTEIQANESALQNRRNDSQVQLQALQRRLEGDLLQKLARATAGYAGQNGLRLVIPTGDILFGDRPADITEPVMRLMETMPNR